IFGIVPFPRPHQAREAAQSVLIKTQRLTDLARRGATPIGNDVGSHGGAALSITLVNILDGALALIAAGQIEIDIRPFAALLGKKTLEEQTHFYGVYGRNPQRVANSAVSRRAAALHQNALLAAISNDVPHNQEI